MSETVSLAPRESLPRRIGRRIHELGDVRSREYRAAYRFLESSPRVLDIACGTGTFLALRPKTTIGLDINPANVEYCQKRGLEAIVGSALQLPFEDKSFDGVHCSHLIQVFSPADAVQTIREMGRVVKPGGAVVLTTLNWFPRFFRHPENVRAYPPDAIWRLFAGQRGAQSPMFPNVPVLQQEKIWLRRPPLVEFYSAVSYRRAQISGVLNSLQSAIGLSKYWRFDAYTAMYRAP